MSAGDLDLSKVKAGEYELVADSWDEYTSKPGQPLDYVTHRKGDLVQLDVEQARRLLHAGAVKEKGKSAKPDDSGELDISKGIDKVVAWVNAGADEDAVKARAKEALDAETAKGDKAREGLTSKLNALLNPES